MIYFYIIALVVTFLGVVINLPGSVHINPILLNFYDAKTVLFLTAIFMTFGSLCRIIVFRKEIVKDKLLEIILFGILGGFVGSYLVGYIDERILILIFIFSGLKFLYEYYRKQDKNDKPNKKKVFLLDEFISGFVASFLQVFGISTGPIRQGYYLARGHSLGATQGTVGFMFFFSGISIVLTRIYYEKMDVNFILVILPLFPFMLAIVYFSKYLIYKIPKNWQEKIIVYSLIISLLSILPQLLR